MGPGDPFSPDTPRTSRTPDIPDGPPRQSVTAPRRAREVSAGRSLGAAWGALAGLAFALVLLTWGAGAAFLVLFCMGAGGALGALVQSLTRRPLNLDAAWRALRD